MLNQWCSRHTGLVLHSPAWLCTRPEEWLHVHPYPGFVPQLPAGPGASGVLPCACGAPACGGVQDLGIGLVTEPHAMLALGVLVLACTVRARRSPGLPPPACAARPLRPSGWRVANSVPRSSTLAARPVPRPLPDGLAGRLSGQVGGRARTRIRGKRRLSTHRYKPQWIRKSEYGVGRAR